MNNKAWAKIFFLELLTVPIVIFLFRTFPDEKRIAAAIAGTIFVWLGGYIIWTLWKSKLRWRALSFWLAGLHLFATSFPLLFMRLLYFDKDFTEILIFGIPGPVFHYHSEKMYVALMVATLVDWILLSRFISVSQKKEKLS